MLSTEMQSTYDQLKREMDAAYIVFKKEPSMVNATRHATAAQKFNSFCIEAMAELADEEPTFIEDTEHILENFDDYKSCKKCGVELLFRVDDKHYIKHLNFVPGFPGYCYACLVKRCCSIDCNRCTLVDDPSTCSFKEVKNIYNDSI